jgi:hypothetical protein
MLAEDRTAFRLCNLNSKFKFMLVFISRCTESVTIRCETRGSILTANHRDSTKEHAYVAIETQRGDDAGDLIAT